MKLFLAWFKTLIFYSYFIFSSAIYGIFCLVIFLFLNQNQRYALIRGFCRACLWVLKYVCSISYRVQGYEHLHFQQNSKHPYILVSKHQSTWETLAFIALFPQRICYVLKKELIYLPIFGWVLGLLGMLYIDRKHGARAFAFLKKAFHVKVAASMTPLIFPEGTRMPVDAPSLQYKSGAARLAQQNQCHVIAISHNAGYFYPKASYLKHAGCIDVYIHPPFLASGSIETVHQKIIQTIEQKQQQLLPNYTLH